MSDPITVHLGTGTPREQFLAFYRDDEPNLDEFRLSYPDHDPGDLVAWIVPGDVPALLNIEEFDDPSSDVLVVDSAGWNIRGVAVAGIERRLGHSLPAPPATLDPVTSQLFLDAAAAEESDPTPWYLIDTTGCADGDQGMARHSWECAACHQRFDHLPLLQARAALQQHHGSELFGGSMVLCASCHAMVHDPFSGGLSELIMAHRPACTRCECHTVMHLEYGMPPGPVPGIAFTGCVVLLNNPGDAVNRHCLTCDNTWFEDDTVVGADGTISGKVGRHTATVSTRVMVPALLSQYLRSPTYHRGSAYAIGRWSKWVGHIPGVSDVLQSLPESLKRDDAAQLIDRIAHDNPAAAFVVAMIWGHRGSGYGPYRTAQILTGEHKPIGAELSPSVVDRLVRSMWIARDEGAVEGYRYLNNDGAIPRLGSDFFTTWLFFVTARGDSTTADAAPILDALVIRWLRENIGMRIRPGQTEDYNRYLTQLKNWGDAYHRTPAEVEERICSIIHGHG